MGFMERASVVWFLSTKASSVPAGSRAWRRAARDPVAALQRGAARLQRLKPDDA
jgi:hypothetical protein